jgi:hypothetical protein
MPTTVTVTVTLDPRTADLLSGDSTEDFYDERVDVFVILPEEMTPEWGDAVLAGGTITWCASSADALPLRKDEESSGFRVALMMDLTAMGITLPGGYAGGSFVLSSRPWRY